MSGAGRAWVGWALWFGLASPAAAIVYVVNAGAACPGSGTTSAPFCAIRSAAAIAAPGDTVDVAAGIYREQVTPASSGAAGLPITYHGAKGARVYGTNNLSGEALWKLSSGTTYSTPYDPPSNPVQVFVNGVALTASSAGAGAVPRNGFFYDNVARVLYVNLGADNPGKRAVEAGARSFGFDVDAKSHLVIEGFEVNGQNTNGIRVRSSANVVVRNNRVLRAASFGIVAGGTNPPTVTSCGPVEISGNDVLTNGDAGIRLRNNVLQATVSANHSHQNANHGISISNTTQSVFSGNTLDANAKPGGVSTVGLLLAGALSVGNRVERNIAFRNQDSGFQLSGGGVDNVVVRNISYANGDHGFDVRECFGPRLISNTAWANTNDGLSIEGYVRNALVRNNISFDNGTLTGGNDLWVDTTSTTGFSADYDVFFRSVTNGASIEYDGGVYETVADFTAATGQEAHGTYANPILVNPGHGDFHPGLGPAIDAADASVADFQALDYAGLPPQDLLAVPNTGAGVPNYADRGALEHANAAPVARLTVLPTTVKIGQLVTADGHTSSDDTPIVSYRFDWGDGSSTTQAGPIATHAYATTGTKHVVLTVTDQGGKTGSVKKDVSVNA